VPAKKTINNNPLLIVISGPSGVGKDSVLAGLKKNSPNLQFITTLTTRQPRPGEVDGRDYTFVSRKKFNELKDKNELLEYAQVYGNWYGPPKAAVREALQDGKDAILRVDVQGVKNIRKIAPEAVFIFLAPASLTELEKRLKNRYTETPAGLALRLKIARDEMKQVGIFDYVVVNRQGQLDAAVSEIQSIIKAEKCRVKTRQIVL